MLDTFEVGGNGVYTSWVANKYNFVGQVFGFQMKVKT
jgi:hypothetical protein